MRVRFYVLSWLSLAEPDGAPEVHEIEAKTQIGFRPNDEDDNDETGDD